MKLVKRFIGKVFGSRVLGSRARAMATYRERGEAVSVPVFKGSRAKGNGDLPRTRRSRERPGVQGEPSQGQWRLTASKAKP
ncbi:hypothetical protein [Paenibacillus xylanilyticus]|uniref:hypothetical protein n=1 Tax=Paenibacillus xylanilyticus TaxID=248903 RepID=UPI00399FD5D0